MMPNSSSDFTLARLAFTLLSRILLFVALMSIVLSIDSDKLLGDSLNISLV